MLSSRIRHALSRWLYPAILLTACGGELPDSAPPPDGSLVDPCAGAYLFAVDDQNLTLLSMISQTFYSDSHTGRWSGGGGVRPGSQTRALIRMSAVGYSGTVELSWDGVPLESVEMDAAFLNAGGTKTVVHLVEGGPLLELHVVARAECPNVPSETMSRAELDLR